MPFQSLSLTIDASSAVLDVFYVLSVYVGFNFFLFFFLPCDGVEVNTAGDIQVHPPRSLGGF